MPLGREVGLGPSNTVLDGDQPFPAQKGAQPPTLDPFLLWPKGWIHQDAT